MKRSALFFSSSLLIVGVASLYGCSSEPSSPVGGSTGGTAPATGGSLATGGTNPSTGGTSPATGGSTGGIVSATGGVLATGGSNVGQGGSTGGTASGGSATGGSVGTTGGVSEAGRAGSSSGGSSAGAGGSSGGKGGGASGGGSGGAGGKGTAGTSGAGGAGGGLLSLASELNGEGWTMKCTDPDPGGGDRCYLYPPNQTACPSGGYTSVDKTLHFGGAPGTTYDVTIHFRGTHEAGDYQGGTANPKQFLKGATHTSGGLHTWLSMQVSSPAATYNPNSGGGAGAVQVYDYSATIQVEGGATIRIKASDSDCLMHRYCQPGTNTSTMPCKGLVVPGISPEDNPIDGGFLQMEVTSVVQRT